jgi:diguanylate cyclase (GGDEF)-like protein
VPDLDPTVLTALGVSLVLGLGVGVLMGRSGRRELETQVEKLEAESARATSQSRDQMRMVARMRGEQSTVAGLVRALPSAIRQFNRSDLEARRVPTLIVQLAEAIFEANQVLLFLVRSPGHDEERARELFLRADRGLDSVPEAARRLRFGEGKIGWVAENKIEMTGEDWPKVARTDGIAVENNHPAFRTDLVGPLVHHSARGEHVLGVLCVGGAKARRAEDKLMLQTVTNLGSMALMNAHNLGQMRVRANTDGLTGLLNKGQFMHELSLMINTAENDGKGLGIFIFDIDHFKNYNDTNGHLAGDELLKTIARVIKQNVRPDDLVCRYGGEEFVVALPETDAETAHTVAQKIRRAIEDFPFAHGKAQPNGNLTISGGVASFPKDGTNGTELISHADQALYQAKAEGRNRVVRFRGVHIGDPEAVDPHGERGSGHDLPSGITTER